MPSQFDVKAERAYYKDSPKTWREAPMDFVNILMRLTAGSDWIDYLYEKDVLELGAGECTYVAQLINIGAPASYIVSDIFEDRYKIARKALASRFDNLEFRILRADKIEMPDTSVDTILAFGLYHHIPDLAGAFREAYRVLRPGGVLIFRDPYAGDPAIFVKYLFSKRSANEWPLDITGTKKALEAENFSIKNINRFWVRFPWLPAGIWSTNIGIVARCEVNNSHL